MTIPWLLFLFGDRSDHQRSWKFTLFHINLLFLLCILWGFVRLSVEDVYLTVASNRIESAQLSDTKIHRAIEKNHYPSRSGDIYLVFKPQHFINDLDGLKVAVVHGSPWTYDTFVPVIFAGMNIPAQHIYKKIETIDVAPTLSAIMKIKAPSATQGNVLVEIFD